MNSANPTKTIERLLFGRAPLPNRTMALCRFFLGLGLFSFYLSFAQDLRPYFGTPRVFGFELAFLHLPHLIEQPTLSLGLYLCAVASSLLFTLGYWTALTGLVTLVLHCLFRGGGAAVFGWAGLIEPFLICIVFSSLAPQRSVWPLRLLKFSVCGLYALVAWGQLRAAPWLEPSIVARYLDGSPFGKCITAHRGFTPLLEIVGGLAWLLQLAAPLLLWHRRLGKYLAVILIALHGILAAIMPLAFWNYVMAISLLAFLPGDWLTLKRSYWSSQLPELRMAARALAFFSLMSVMLLTIFDRNIAEQFEIFDHFKDTPRVEKGYEIVSNPLVGIGNLILFNSIWKMYSPTWRHVVWIEWYLKKPDGSVINWPQDNFSPDYRMRRRTWLQAVWTDFKKEKVFVGQLSGDKEREAYGKYLCRDIQAKTGAKPVSVHPEIFSFDIRGPAEDWSLKSQGFERREVHAEVPCD